MRAEIDPWLAYLQWSDFCSSWRLVAEAEIQWRDMYAPFMGLP